MRRFFNKGLRIFLLLLSFAATAFTDTFYVAPNGTGNGSSWSSPMGDIQAAIDACAATGGGEVRVAQGTYRPTSQPNIATPTGDARDNHFSLKDTVYVRGGFSIYGVPNPQLYPTILSGDLTSNDKDLDSDGFIDPGSMTDNCRHVFYHPGTASISNTARLEGVIISGGFDTSLVGGGGMYNGSGISPVIKNTVFRNNYSEQRGGGLFKEGAYSGGAPILDSCTFVGNQGSQGGGACLDGPSGSNIVNCTFYANKASIAGGGLFQTRSTTTIRNSTIVGNLADIFPGAVFSAPAINCIVWGNWATTSSPQASGPIGYSIVQGGYTGTGNLDSDPLLMPLDNYGGNVPTIAIFPDSPAINAGTPSIPTVDQRGYSRLDSPRDIGAYEYVRGQIVFVKPGGTGGGSSWADAMGDIQQAIDSVVLSPPYEQAEIWVAKGSYRPKSMPRGGNRPHFATKNGVSILGGFSGNETTIFQRNPARNSTILSGDINGDDADIDRDGLTDEETMQDNAAHVFFHPHNPSITVDPLAIIDGCTISGGNAFLDNNKGGGIYNGPRSDPTIRNCIIQGNRARWGAAIYNDQTCMDPAYPDESVFVKGCTIVGNDTEYDGTIVNYQSRAIFENCTLADNRAGGMAAANNYNNSKLSMINCTITGNTGAGLLTSQSQDGSSALLINSIAWGNLNGWLSGVTASYSVIEGGYSGLGNLNADPLLMPLGFYGGPTPTCPVFQNSPAINRASPSPVATATDQRGFARQVFPDNPTPDIGACEWQEDYLVIQTSDDVFSYPQGARVVLDAVSESDDLTGAEWQWFIGPVGDTSNPISGATQSRFVTPPLTQDTQYWVRRDFGGLSAGINLSVDVPSVVFVKPDGSDGNDGSSWATALRTVSAALGAAAPGQDIWVAAGTYRLSGSPLSLRNNVRLMGGFGGWESMVTERNIAANPTVLSADLNGDDSDGNGDGTPDSNLSDNLPYIFDNSGIGRMAVLDGLVLSGATQQAIWNNYSSPTITNCVFTANSGGMTENQGGSPVFDSCAFFRNGAGIRSSYSSPTFKNCSFWDNFFNPYGYPPDGLIIDGWDATSLVINCTILSEPGQPSIVSDNGNVVISNCILWGNGDSAPAISWNGVDVSNCIIQGGYSGGANVISDDPLLLPAGYYAGPTPSMPVSAGSLSIDAGVFTANTTTFDQRGFVRDAQPDIGACEWQDNLVIINSGNDANRYAMGSTASLSVVSESVLPGTLWEWYRGEVGDTGNPIVGEPQSRYVTDPLTADATYWVRGWTQDGPIEAGITLNIYVPNVIYVAPRSSGDGSSWQNAMPGVQDALNFSQSGDQIWVAAGTYNEQITLRNGVAVYGGFNGTETRIDQRNIAANPTILSADRDQIDVDANGDGFPDTQISDNASGICVSDAVGSTALLDGFILYGSRTVAVANLNGSSATIANCTFRGNLGTCVQNWDSSSPNFLNCTFHHNAAGKVMIQNTGTGSPSVVNCTFNTNPATTHHVVENLGGSPEILSCTFAVNSNQTAIYNAPSSSPVIGNSIIWGNTNNSGITNNSTSASVWNCVIEGGFTGGTNIITQNPNLLPLANYGGATSTMPVSAGSVAIGQGQAGGDILPYADQRGFVRGATRTTIGACEWQHQGVVAIIPEEGTDRYAIGTQGVLAAFSESASSGISWQWYRGVAGDTNNPIDGATMSRYGTAPLASDAAFWVRGNIAGTHFDGGIALTVYTPSVIYVNATGNHGDGSSWQFALPDLQSALDVAQSGDQIWVAAGTYTVFTNLGFILRGSSVSVYGGFSGVETRLDQRDIAAHPTILSADILGNDADSDGDGIPDPTTTTDNASYIFRSSGMGPSVLDGFILSGAKSAAFLNYRNSPTIANCTFRHNLGSCIVNTLFSGPVIRNCTFHNNAASSMAVRNIDYSSPTIVNCTLNSATATVPMVFNTTQSSPKITNCTFAVGGNQSAIYSAAGSNASIRNSIIWGSFSPAVTGSATVLNCVIQYGFSGGTSIITQNPLLLPIGNYGGPTLTIPLRSGSPAISSAATGSDIPYFDQRGFVRDAQPDIGAFEFGHGVGAISGEAPSQATAIGAPVSLEAYCDGPSPTYQWFYGDTGDTSSPVDNGNFATLNLGFQEFGVKVWARIWPGGGAPAIDTDSRTIEIRGTFQDWCDFHGLSGADRDPQACLAGDGISNLVKFALGMQPKVEEQLSEAMIAGFDPRTNSLVQEWTLSKTPSDLSFGFEFSETLSNWSASGVTATLVGESESLRTWRIEAPVSAKGVGFLRMRASR